MKTMSERQYATLYDSSFARTQQGKLKNNDSDVQRKNTCEPPFPLSQDCIEFQLIDFPASELSPPQLTTLELFHSPPYKTDDWADLPSAMTCMTTLLLPDPSRLLNAEGPRDDPVLLIPP
jgi:hypothetical protein